MSRLRVRGQMSKCAATFDEDHQPLLFRGVLPGVGHIGLTWDSSI